MAWNGEKSYRRQVVAAVMQLAKQEGYNNVELVHVRELDDWTELDYELQRPYRTIDTDGMGYVKEQKEIKKIRITIRCLTDCDE